MQASQKELNSGIRGAAEAGNWHLIKGLLERYAGEDMGRLVGSNHSDTVEILKCVLEVLVIIGINSAKKHLRQEDDLSGVGVTFLSNFATKVMGQVTRGGNGSSSTEKVFVAFIVLVFRGSTIVCRAARAAHAAADDGKQRLGVQASLKNSFVNSVLPLTVAICNAFADELWLATPVLPYIIELAKVLDDLNKISDLAKISYEALQKVEDFEIQTSSFGPASAEGPVDVFCRFDFCEKSDDVVIEDDGKLFRSTASNNQHCLVDVGVSSGKCAWEFKLLADSEFDECSAFGVACKPITSSSYESSMNMWVRRSYNGQLYHGTSAGFDCFPKIHPGDILRIEVDMDEKTLRFRKNGVDEGLAFVDLQGEVFPIVCTYRSGIEVKLIKTELWGGLSDAFKMTEYSAAASSYKKTILATNIMELRLLDNLGSVSNCSFSHRERHISGSWLSVVSENGFDDTVRVWDVHVKNYHFEGGLVVGVMFGSLPKRRNFDGDSDLWSKDGGTHIGQLENCLALSNDGTLYMNKVKYKGNYGDPKFRSLKAGDVINVCLDLDAFTLSFGLNGEFFGVAFDVSCFPTTPQRFYPAASLKTFNDHVSFVPAGLGNTTISLNWAIKVEKALAHLGGRLAGTLISGPSTSIEEMGHDEWLSSPMIIGGLERNEELSENWMINVAAAHGMSLILGEEDGPKTRSDTLLGGTLSFTTSDQIKALVDDDVIEDRNSLEMPTRPDLMVRDRILDDIALVPRSAAGEKFYSWMEGLVGEPVFLKNALDKKGCYSFPLCEQPFLAALLKHSGLWREVTWLINRNSSPSSACRRMPSDSMRFLFGKIKTLRGFLRRKRQLLLSKEEEGGEEMFEELCWRIRDRGEFLRGTKAEDRSSRRQRANLESESFGMDGDSTVATTYGLASPQRSQKPPAPPSVSLSPIKLYRTRSTPIRPTFGVGDVALDDDNCVEVMKSCGSYVIVDDTFVEKQRAESENSEDDKKEDKDGDDSGYKTSVVFPPSPLQLSVLLARRKLRALSRAYGFRGLYELIKNLGFGCDVDALLYLKVAMRGKDGGSLKETLQDSKWRKKTSDRRPALALSRDVRLSGDNSNAAEEAAEQQSLQHRSLNFARIRRAAAAIRDMSRDRNNSGDNSPILSNRLPESQGMRNAGTPETVIDNDEGESNSRTNSVHDGARDGEFNAKHYDKSLNSSSHRHHYLRGLESCPPLYLSICSNNFHTLYSHIIVMLKRAFKESAVGTAVVIMQKIMLDWDPRDHRSIVEWSLIDFLKSSISAEAAIGNFLAERKCENPRFWSVKGLRNAILQGRVGWDGVFDVVMRSFEMEAPRAKKEAIRIFQSPSLTSRSPGLLIKQYAKAIKLVSTERKKQSLRIEQWKKDGIARQAREDKRARGVRFTYVVTASNGVGVRSLPNSAASRTGKSYKCDELAEVSYRFSLDKVVANKHSETYLRLVNGGWLFDVGIRTPYKNKKIMKEIKCEEWSTWWEHWLKIQGKEIGAWKEEPSVALCHGGTTAVHRESVKIVLSGSTHLKVGHGNYFEVIVRSGGTTSDIGIGVKVERILEKDAKDGGGDEGGQNDTKLDDVGANKGTYGYRVARDTYYAHGRSIRSPGDHAANGVFPDRQAENYGVAAGDGRDVVRSAEAGVPTDPTQEALRMMEIEDFQVHEEPRRHTDEDATAFKIKVDRVYGCGVDFASGTIFFTCDGAVIGKFVSREILSGMTSAPLELKLVPTVSLGGNHEIVELNYGSFGFAYSGKEVVTSEKCLRLGERRRKQEEEDQERAACALRTCRAENERDSEGGEEEGGAEVEGRGETDEMSKDHASKKVEASSFSFAGSDNNFSDLSIAQFATLSDTAWELFKKITTKSLNASDTNDSGVDSSAERSDDNSAMPIVEHRWSWCRGMFGTEMEREKDYFTRNLQSKCLTFLLHDIASATDYFFSEWVSLKTELHVYSRLKFLSDIGNHKACMASIADPEFIARMFLLLERGSPRIQLLVLELMSRVAPISSCSSMDAALNQAHSITHS